MNDVKRKDCKDRLNNEINELKIKLENYRNERFELKNKMIDLTEQRDDITEKLSIINIQQIKDNKSQIKNETNYKKNFDVIVSFVNKILHKSFFTTINYNQDNQMIFIENYIENILNKNNITLTINTNELFFTEEQIRNDMEFIFNNYNKDKFSEILALDEIHEKTGIKIQSVTNNIDYNDKNAVIIVLNNGNVHQITNEEEKEILKNSNIKSNNFEILKYNRGNLI